ncbi:homoserine dehydrogenase [Butyrivibrio sp. NC3005]|uniref:homoserine dehydrogenase n=1 Tax=Butyrivibrio sp. NC3005 TaxID=1280685 RepID=UPI0003F61C73|nr:homoserine dehydrogenase [Butyrivibrio sp. NC3005]
MKKINIGMLGIGNIGVGTYRTLEMSRAKIEQSTGMSLDIVKILNRHPEKDRGIDIPKEKYVSDIKDIVEDPDIDIVVELIGGIEPATTYMAEALKHGKHVVTANKAAIAANGKYLQELAYNSQLMLRFEASVAGGIPILNAISSALISNEFSQVQGILNGTTNYILTKMTENGTPYEDVLIDAQKKGFAEADPTADVEGIDAANKLSILISLLFGIGIKPENIPTKGITSVTSEDISFAKEFGYKIKLLASAHNSNGKVTCNVEPSLVPENHPLANVNNEFNAVYITGNAVDNLMFYGRGAGPLPTGSAVIGDVVSVARKIEKDAAYDLLPHLRYDADLEFAGEGSHQYYIRVHAEDHPGVLGQITSTLGVYGIGIKTMMQRAGDNSGGTVPMIFIVYDIDQSILNTALNVLLTNGSVQSVDNVLRVLKNN